MPTLTPVSPVATPVGVFAGDTTWLCNFSVMADMPTSLGVADMEGLIAGILAAGLNNYGLPGNVSAQLTATTGNVTVSNPTPPVLVAPTPPVTGAPLL
jgi:hypothetical protein